MSKTIQIRNASEDVYSLLAAKAAEQGVSVPSLVRREAIRLALSSERPNLSMKEWLDRVSQRSIRADFTREHILEALDEIRGPWPQTDPD